MLSPPPTHSHPPLCVCHQMPGSSGTTQSMKKTIGHRGVETTTGETTYKKVGVAGGSGLDPLTAWLQNQDKAPKIFGILKLVETFSILLRIASCSWAKKEKWRAHRFFFLRRRRHQRWKVPSSWESLTQLAAWAKKQSGTCSCKILWWWKASSSPGRSRKLHKPHEIMTF